MVKNQGKILIVEDNANWQRSLQDLLEEEGFSVDVVSTYDEAVRNLSERIYHLAIFDIRLAEEDLSNAQGMDLLRNLTPQKSLSSLGIIILSAYGTKHQMREAFGTHNVDDFIDKNDFNRTEFIEGIRSIFLNKIRINLNLEINWMSGDAEQATSNLRFFDNTSIKKKSPVFQKLIADELNDLLMRLFHNSESVLLKSLKGGQSNSQVLWAKAFDHERGGTASFIVKFGDIKSIEIEKENFEKYIIPYLEGGRHTSIVDVRYNQRLGSIIYKLLGTSDENLTSFGDFYSNSSTLEVQNLLANLFEETCYSWYKNAGVEHTVNLTQYYLKRINITKEKLESHLNGLKVAKTGEGKFIFKTSDEEFAFINPLEHFVEKDIILPTYECIIHGDLNPGNILVDQSKKAWLIDFGNTEVGHILRDFIVLDSVIRYELLTSEQASLKERLDLERVLCKIDNFNQLLNIKDSFQTENEYLAKTFSTVVYLRTLAAQILPNKKQDFSEYQLALLFYALNSIRFTSTMEIVQRQHALLSACLLTEHLKQRGIYG